MDEYEKLHSDQRYIDFCSEPLKEHNGCIWTNYAAVRQLEQPEIGESTIKTEHALNQHDARS